MTLGILSMSFSNLITVHAETTTSDNKTVSSEQIQQSTQKQLGLDKLEKTFEQVPPRQASEGTSTEQFQQTTQKNTKLRNTESSSYEREASTSSIDSTASTSKSTDSSSTSFSEGNTQTALTSGKNSINKNCTNESDNKAASKQSTLDDWDIRTGKDNVHGGKYIVFTGYHGWKKDVIIGGVILVKTEFL